MHYEFLHMKTNTNTYFIPNASSDSMPSLSIANALFTELLAYGYEMDSVLFTRLAKSDEETARNFSQDLLKDYTIGKLNKPIFNNWESRTEFSFSDITVQIFGYIFQVSGNDLYDPGYMPRLLENTRGNNLVKINLASDEDAINEFVKLVTSTLALDKKAQAQLFKAAGLLSNKFYKFPFIKSDESRVSVLRAITTQTDSASLFHNFQSLGCKPADVMRYACVKNGDFKHVRLPHDAKFQNLSWQERNGIIDFLNSKFSFEQLSEAFGKNRKLWRKFFRHINLFRQNEFTKFTNLNVAAMVSVGFNFDSVPLPFVANLKEKVKSGVVEISPAGSLAYRTFASRVMKVLASGNLEEIISVIDKNSSYLFRNLGTIANVIKKSDERLFVNWVRQNIERADIAILFSILAIDVNAEYRIIDVKGDTIIQEANYSPIIAEIQGDIIRSIRSRFGFEGRVEFDLSLKDNIVPFLSKNADLDRGTTVKLKENAYLYFLCHWVESEKRRTDLDISFVCFDYDWEPETIYFGNQVNEFLVHSGDYTSAPAPYGATEYARIDLWNIPKNVKYIVPIINVYSGSMFSKNSEAYAGFMFSNSAEFNINNDHVRYDLSQPAKSNIPFILDVDKQAITILDYNSRNSLGLTAHSEIDNMRKLISASQTKNVITIEVLAKILSGDSTNISLTISDDSQKNSIKSNDLYTLFS